MILYFSGTGNSLAIARAIAEHVGDKVLPLREAVQTDLSQEITKTMMPPAKTNYACTRSE